MSLYTTIRIALRAISKNKMRAGLTILGIVIGIAAITAMVSIGQSAGALIQNQLRNLGTNVILVFPGSSEDRGVRGGLGSNPTLTAADASAIVRECASVLAASPIVSHSGQVIYGGSNWRPNELSGVGIDYLTVRNWPLSHGDFFTERDITSAAKVCVIGNTLVRELFQTSNPLGETIRIKNIPFRVIGILETKGANLVGQDQDNVVIAPYTTVRKRLRGGVFKNVDAIMASARSEDRTPDAQNEIQQLLYERHDIDPGESPDFRVHSTTEIAAVLGVVTGSLTLLLSAIAGISLVVGGVGIMNIMLVSVTERTREIGIRLAVGARERDIRRQFLVESIVLSVIGGIFGILFGVASAKGITMLIDSFTPGTPWPSVISVRATIVALLFSAAVGIFFGYYPARRASRLDPIDALRYE